MSNNHPAAMTVANNQSIVQMIRTAQHRLVVLAPGLRRAVAEAIGQQWKRLGADAVTVILDVDPEVCRMGYGEIEAIQHLEPIAGSLGAMVNHHPGVRIGLIMADDETLIYAPTPLLIESSPPALQNPTQAAHQPLKPNAIRIGIPPADVERDLGLGADGASERVIGLDKADKATIQEVLENLKDNPPQKFDISRSVRVFNAQFEFVEFELKGAAIDRKTVRIPNTLLGFANDPWISKTLRASFHLVEPQSTISGKRLHRMKAWIIKRFLTHLPTYGFIVLRKDKPDLETAVKQMRRCVVKFEKRMRRELQSEMNRKRESLTQALLPRVLENPPEDWEFIAWDESGYERVLKEELEEAFGKARDLIREMEVKLVFKAVTYESLNDPKFCDLVRERLPDIGALHSEYLAAKGVPSWPNDNRAHDQQLFKGAA